MKRNRLFNHVLLFTLFIFPLISLPVKPSFANEQFTGKVVGVLDGDTIEVMNDGKAQRIRLEGIDCPEKNQPFGNRAKQFASELAFGKIVTVQVKTMDRYHRLVANVILPDGRNLNHELVKAGLAWWYKKYSPKDPVVEQLESEAKTNKHGLWSNPDPIPPWEWRRGS